MADCREQVYSDEFFDFIVSYEETNEQTIAGACIQRIDEGYDIFYYFNLLLQFANLFFHNSELSC